ncbi:MAG: thioredoxin [Lachnospirales bacterium]
MSNIVNESNFDTEVLGSDKVVLVDFYADWCGPCKMVAPILEEIATENTDIKVCKVNVDNSQDLAGKYGVVSIPTLVVIKNGEVVNKHVGALPKDKILSLVK